MKDLDFKRAFTMVELIFIVIIIGILAAVIIPRSQNNSLREAADQIVSHIRYTQHLAMMDDKFDPNDTNWAKKRWQIIFNNSSTYTNDKFSYSIFSDNASGSTGNADKSEIAINPQDPSRLLSGGSSSFYSSDEKATKGMHIGNKYGITDVTFSDSCSNGISPNKSKRLAFDYLGRPLKGNIVGLSLTNPYDTTYLMVEKCTITLTNSAGENINITIEPETGFAQVVSS
jgi:type II secretory pathway pseudopilin PulG